MIRAEKNGDLTFLRMARRIAGVPVYWTGAYVASGVLVDCGPPATAGELVRLLKGEELRGLVITHHHEDHMGGAAALLAARSLPAHVSPAGRAVIDAGFHQEPYRLLAWGRAPRMETLPLGEFYEAGPLRLRVIPTPGHSPDHVCFFEEKSGRLFTGDLFLSERQRFLRSDEDLHGIIASLERVLALPVREVLCAHRGPLPGGAAPLQRKRDHLVRMRDEVGRLLAQGVSEHEVTRRAVGSEGFLTAFSAGRFSARNFVRAVARGPASSIVAPAGGTRRGVV